MSSYDTEYDCEPPRAWFAAPILWPVYVAASVVVLVSMAVFGWFWDDGAAVSTGKPVGLINRALKAVRS